MAIAHVANRHASGVTTVGNSTPLDLATGASITVGNHLILFTALDNSGTAGVDPNCEGIADPVGNTWIRLGKFTRTSGAANDGAHVEAWFCRVVVPYANGDDITPVYSFPVARGAFRINEFSGIRPVSYPASGPVYNNSNITTIGGLGLTPDTGQLVVCMAAIETNTAITGDADTTNGSWSAIGTTVSNSGTDATSMTVAVQYKIVTAAGAQSWAATKTGAADWAAMGFVLDTYTPVAPDFVPGNPSYSCIAGPENLGTLSQALPIDTGTAYMFTHKIFPDDIGSQDYAMVTTVGVTSSVETDPVSNHTIVGDLYLAGNELPVKDIISNPALLFNGSALGSGAQVWNPDLDAPGSGTADQALAAVGGECIRLEAGESVDVTFGPAAGLAAIYANHRVLRWGIRYVAFKDDSEVPGPSNGIAVEIHDTELHGGTGGSYLVGGWLVGNYRGTAQYETRWFGEVNGNPRAFRQDPLIAGVLPQRACWTMADIALMDSAELFVRIQAVESDVFIDYIEAVFQLAPERRVAHGARTVSTAPYAAGNYPTGNRVTRMVTASDAADRWVVDDTDSSYVLVVREGLPPSPSDLYPALVALEGGQRTVAPLESIGPALQLTAPVGPRATLEPNPTIRTGVLSLGVLQAEPVESDTLQGASVTALDAINYPIEGSFFPSYYLSVASAGNDAQVYSGHDLNQYIVVPGGQQYTRIKLLVARDDLTTADLDISVEQPAATPIATATVTVADVSALPDMGSGFVEVSVVLDVPITPSAGRVLVVLSSGTGPEAPWSIGGAIPPFVYAGYDPGSPTASTEPYDYSVVLQCPLVAPTYTLGSVTQDVVVGSEQCTVSTTSLPQITLTNAEEYDWIAIHRVVSGEDPVPAILLEDPDDNHVFIDYEVPWDIPAGEITYVITGYRDADHLSTPTTTTAWNDTSSAPGAAFGLFSNEESAGYAYIPADPRAVELEYRSLNQVDYIQRHGVDFQTAVMSPEERGLAVTATVIVSRMARCEDPGESPVAGTALAMSPEPFDDLRSLERNRRMVVKFPGGHSRFVHVRVGSMNVRVQHGVYMGEITLTDAEWPDLEPWS